MENKIIVNRDYVIGKIEDELWGTFVEHMGRSVYGGMYEPTHKLADEDGFRRDVIDMVKELKVPVIRYPGGNFLSGYNWRDGIGKARPVNLDLAWGQLEPNSVGIHEFQKWIDKVDSKMMMSVNMGTGTPKEAGQLVEYCNFKGGTRLSDERIANGRKQPFDIKKWCIGNEMDGDWQICGLTAEEYGRKARETAKIMKWVDKDIQLVIAGSSSPAMASYPQWDRVVLEHTYDMVDYISLHRYYTYTPEKRMEDFLASHNDLDTFIKTVTATADYVKTFRRSSKKMMLSIDEWNVWHTMPTENSFEVSNDTYTDRWTVGPRRVENVYDMADALCFSGLMCTLINNADRVKMGCLAQLINVIAPVFTENNGRSVRQTTYYPYQLAIKHAKGEALNIITKCKTVDTVYGSVGVLKTSCCYDEATGEYALILVNNDKEDGVYTLQLSEDVTMSERIVMSSENVHAANTFDRPFTVLPQNIATEQGRKSKFEIKLGKYSFNLIKFKN